MDADTMFGALTNLGRTPLSWFLCHTPDLANGALHSAANEVKTLKELCPSLGLNPITPPRRRDDVLGHLKACKISHFAGHGESDPAEPSQGRLLLEDWRTNPLTVGDLRFSLTSRRV